VTSLEVHTLREDQGEIEKDRNTEGRWKRRQNWNHRPYLHQVMNIISLPRINVILYGDTKFCILTSKSMLVVRNILYFGIRLYLVRLVAMFWCNNAENKF
jgi:hypothetical protein